MGTLIAAGQLILALAILVSLHEWGHYITARKFGIRVEKFFIFFDAWGVKLFSKKIGDTEWGIGWLPLGGYVKISGMIDESLDKDQLATEPEDHEFRSKPAWQRLIVMIGGVTVNFILGIFIFAMVLFYYGESWVPNDKVIEKGGISVSELGSEAGFVDGDKVLSVNNNEVEKFRELVSPENFINGELVYQVQRGSEKIDISVPDSIAKEVLEGGGKKSLFSFRILPICAGVEKGLGAEAAGFEIDDQITKIDSIDVPYYDGLGSVLANYKSETIPVTILRGGKTVVLNTLIDTGGRLGIRMARLAQYEDDVQITKYGFFEAFPAGYKKGMGHLMANVKAFGLMFKGKLNPVKSMKGPIGIMEIFGEVWDWQKFWMLTGSLSFILAFMNLLPIPALDGGHVVFLLIEMIIRRPLPEKVMYVFQVIGMVILFSLMIFIFGVDIYNKWFA